GGALGAAGDQRGPQHPVVLEDAQEDEPVHQRVRRLGDGLPQEPRPELADALPRSAPLALLRPGALLRGLALLRRLSLLRRVGPAGGPSPRLGLGGGSADLLVEPRLQALAAAAPGLGELRFVEAHVEVVLALGRLAQLRDELLPQAPDRLA